MRTYARPKTDEVLEYVRDYGPATIHDIANVLGRTLKSVIQCLETLHKEHAVYIAGYTRITTHGKWSPQYKAGNKPDKPKPENKAHKQSNAEYRQRYRALINAKNVARNGNTYNIWKGLL